MITIQEGALTLAGFKKMLRARVSKAGGVRALAREVGLKSATHITLALKAGTKPYPAVVKALGYKESSTMYEEAP